MPFERRIGLLRAALISASLDAMLITHEANITYLCGFTGHGSSLLITKKKAFFITDPRYIEEARCCVAHHFGVHLAKGLVLDAAAELALKLNVRRFGFESSHLAYGWAKRIVKHIKPARLIEAPAMIENMRSIKDPGEIGVLRSSARLANKVMRHVVSRIRPGISEEAIAKEIEFEFLKRGVRQSFSSIVASGANASKPHACPGAMKVRNNSFVMLDLGCILNGYCSDITRMCILGRVAEKFRRIYRIVATAQETAIGLIRPGVRMSDIDRAARGVIEKSGYGKYFCHSLGHGVGLEVHERPAISSGSRDPVRAGMVFTIEPAIYLPGYGGVRIEDMVLVTGSGCEILTR